MIRASQETGLSTTFTGPSREKVGLDLFLIQGSNLFIRFESFKLGVYEKNLSVYHNDILFYKL